MPSHSKRGSENIPYFCSPMPRIGFALAAAGTARRRPSTAIASILRTPSVSLGSMPMATIIDGKAVAARLRADVARDAAEFAERHGRPPGLATVLIGDDPGSAVYVANKHRASEE